MKRRLLGVASVMAVTLATAGVAFAEDAPEAPAPSAAVVAPSPAPVAPVATVRTVTEPALPLRAPQPLELAKPAPSSSSWGARLGLVALAGLGAFAYLRKKRGKGLTRESAAAPRIRVHARTSLAFRTEVAVVEVGGMRLLVGVTPSTLQTLAILPDEAGEAADLAATMRESGPEAELEMPRVLAPSDPARLRAPLAAQLEAPSLADRARALFEGPDKKLAQAALTISSAAKYASRAQDLSRAPEGEDEDEDEAPAPKPSRRPRAAAREAREEVPPKAALQPRTSRASLPPARTSRPPVEGQARGLLLALGTKR